MEIKPLNVLKKRKMSYIPDHFGKIKISELEFIDSQIIDWVDSKLIGRYAISELPSILEGRLKISTYIAFEDKKELTYFMLACPFLRR